MKKTKITIALIGVALVASLLVFTKMTGSATYILTQKWQPEFIEDGSEVYCFNEDEAGYYVFMYDSAEAAEELLAWQEEEGDTISSGSYSEAAKAWMEEAEVPENLSREFLDGPYYYMTQEDGSEMIVFLDGKLVHIVEHTM